MLVFRKPASALQEGWRLKLYIEPREALNSPHLKIKWARKMARKQLLEGLNYDKQNVRKYTLSALPHSGGLTCLTLKTLAETS
jgi:hypothetical protein